MKSGPSDFIPPPRVGSSSSGRSIPGSIHNPRDRCRGEVRAGLNRGVSQVNQTFHHGHCLQLLRLIGKIEFWKNFGEIDGLSTAMEFRSEVMGFRCEGGDGGAVAVCERDGGQESRSTGAFRTG